MMQTYDGDLDCVVKEYQSKGKKYVLNMHYDQVSLYCEDFEAD